MSWTAKLSELGIELPPAVKPVAAYVPAVQTGNLVYTAGQVPMVAGEMAATGKVGAEVSPEKGKESKGPKKETKDGSDSSKLPQELAVR